MPEIILGDETAWYPTENKIILDSRIVSRWPEFAAHQLGHELAHRRLGHKLLTIRTPYRESRHIREELEATLLGAESLDPVDELTKYKLEQVHLSSHMPIKEFLRILGKAIKRVEKFKEGKL